MEEKIIIETKTWEAHEYHHVPRSMDWVWAVGLIALLMAVAAFYFHNPLFGIFILLSGTILIVLTLRQPDTMIFELNSEGFKTGTHFHPFKKLKGFIIKEGNPNNKLIIEIDKYFLPVCTFPLPKEISKEVETELLKMIPKIELHEPQTLQFMEKIGF